MNLRRVGHSLIFRLVAMGILLAAAGTTARYLLLRVGGGGFVLAPGGLG